MSQRILSEENLIKVLTGHRQKLDAVNLQSIQIGLFAEYLASKLIDKLIELETVLAKHQIQVDLALDLKNFPDWAQEQFLEIQKQAAQQLADDEDQTGTPPKIDLED